MLTDANCRNASCPAELKRRRLTGLSKASIDSHFQRLNLRLHCASRKASAYGMLESI